MLCLMKQQLVFLFITNHIKTCGESKNGDWTLQISLSFNVKEGSFSSIGNLTITYSQPKRLAAEVMMVRIYHDH